MRSDLTVGRSACPEAFAGGIETPFWPRQLRNRASTSRKRMRFDASLVGGCAGAAPDGLAAPAERVLSVGTTVAAVAVRADLCGSVDVLVSWPQPATPIARTARQAASTANERA